MELSDSGEKTQQETIPIMKTHFSLLFSVIIDSEQ